MLQQTLGFIGAGQMARALAGGFVKAGMIAPAKIVAADPVPGRRRFVSRSVPEARGVADNASVAAAADVIVLATKPQQVAAALADLEKPTRDKLVISIAAGVKLSTLAGLLNGARLVRVMPNTPCLIGQSASGYCLGPAGHGGRRPTGRRAAGRGGPRLRRRRKTARRRDRACRVRVRRLFS